ncbi:hypothetical protein [Kordia sp.]|uniref:hypothetical protein n=1 Tax=Kordia sp. TaxID=1965332 RepID=UPI0025BF7CE3|nr:hypothetical protein [Kordia sp.]MCH2195756.1 hypothetical protein [Kordia sp.]
MIGEFLSKITLTHTAIITVVCLIIMIILAYKKPKWYTGAKGLIFVVIGLIVFYSVGWKDAIDHHDIAYMKQTRVPDYLTSILLLLVIVDGLWLDKVCREQLEVEENKR